MIPHIAPIAITPRPLNQRLWALYTKERDGTITRDERDELDSLCDALEQANEGNA